jgi:hypothetical protein
MAAGQTITRLTASPKLLSDGSGATLRMAGGGNLSSYYLGAVHYRAGVADVARFQCQFAWDDNGWSGGARPQIAAVSWSPSILADVANYSNLYMWKDAPLTAEVGIERNPAIAGTAEPASWTTILTGLVQNIAVQEGQINFTVSDNAGKLDKPISDGHFAGTGNIEGPAEAEGREKRRSFGYVFNVEGRILDKANNIWEFGDPAFPFQSFVDVKDMGRSADPAFTTVAWQGSIGATLAALQVATAQPGSGVVAPSIACVKWWTTPQGPLTADIIGSGDYGNTAVALAKHIANEAGLTMSTVVSPVTTMMANTANAGLHVGSDSLSKANALDQLLMGAGLFWRFSTAGTLDLLPVEIANPVAALRADNIIRQKIFLPHKKRRLGYKRNNRQHSDSEISAALLAADPTVLTADEKTRWLAGQAADMEGRYTFLRARAVELALSTTTLDTVRTNWKNLLGVYNPAWNDTTQDTTIYTTRLTPAQKVFPGGWTLGPGTTATAAPPLTTLADASGTLNGVIGAYDFSCTVGNNLAVGVAIKKSATPTTNWVLVRVGTRRADFLTVCFGDMVLNPYTGGFVAGAASLPAGTVFGKDIFDLGDYWYVIGVLYNVAASSIGGILEIYPAISNDGATFVGYNAAATGSAVVLGVPDVTLGDWFDLGRNILTGRLNAYSAQLTAMQRSVSQVDALTSVVIDGKKTLEITADSTGAIKTGQLPRGSNYTAKAGNTDYTTSGTWSVSTTSGSATATIGAATGILSLTALGTVNATLSIQYTYGPIVRNYDVSLKRVDDPPTNSGGGSGGGSGSGASTTTLGNTTGTSYDLTNAVSAIISAAAGATGKVNLAAPLAFLRNSAATGATGAAGKWQWRVVGGSFADVTTEVASNWNASSNAGDGSYEDGALTVNQSKTGLTTGTLYEFRFCWRDVVVSGTAARIYRSGGTLTATGA